MDKRLAKRHKRQVSRAREKVRVSEPDVRTPEEIAAAKAISRPEGGRDLHPWPASRGASTGPTEGSGSATEDSGGTTEGSGGATEGSGE